jgi:uncharacterized protein
MALSRKFKTHQHFATGIGSHYQLLPFNFHKTSEQEYLCVNIVGEYLRIEKEFLIRLVNGKLDASSDIYKELKSKHMLMDNDSSVAIDLLALKYRTKQHRVAQFTSLHIFVVTLRCDYTCKYCQVSRRMESADAFDMSTEAALASLKLMFMSPSPSLKIEFQGGEPLLNFELIKFIVLNALSMNKKENRSLQFVVTSNLTYVDDEFIKFCAEYDIYISTSLDGPEYLHNKNRPRPGTNGYAKTIEGIKRVQTELGMNKLSALMTTTAESIDKPLDIVDEYVKQNLHSIFLRPLSPYGFAIKTKQTEKYNIDNWMEFYRSGLRYIIELNRSGYFMTEQYTKIILQKIFNPHNPGYVDLQSPAGAGISAVVYNYDGDVYASDEARMLKEMGDEKFKLGNVLENTYEEIFTSAVLLDTLEESLPESAPMCSECGLLSYCGADPVYHFATQGDVLGKKPLSFFCKKNTSIIEHIFMLLNDADDSRVLESWLW